MVIFRSSEGKAGYHQAETVEESIRFVERLRNEEGVEQAHIFRMEEVPFEFRPYYRVAIRGDAVEDRPAAEQPASPPSAPTGREAPPKGDAEDTDDVEDAHDVQDVDGVEDVIEPVPVEEGSGNGSRRGLFGR